MFNRGGVSSEFAAYTDAMPGGTRFYHPKSPVTIAALLVLLFILIRVVLSQMGWLGWLR